MTKASPEARRSQCRAVEESREEQPNLSSTSPARSSRRGTSEGKTGRFAPNRSSPAQRQLCAPPRVSEAGLLFRPIAATPTESGPWQDHLVFRLWVQPGPTDLSFHGQYFC